MEHERCMTLIYPREHIRAALFRVVGPQYVISAVYTLFEFACFACSSGTGRGGKRRLAAVSFLLRCPHWVPDIQGPLSLGMY